MQNQNATHVIFDVSFEHFPIELESADFWKKLGKKALEKGNFSVMGGAMHKFDPAGMSGFWLLCESHLSFHTWPEERRVFIDLFSCGDENRTKKTIDELIRGFERINGVVERRNDLKRGYVYESEE
ncbi:hypothetical protein HN784_04190 [bacterium]|jgi:S-adenosylmethionine decarboxylase|nr:hypothetical protein [bacterium]MBT4251192.1 hypothetical protein [bacterium]MBT4598016.1 hypothetical protein [bacterium]MBT6753571.1 hypothetical protein [bacterium]MBT7037686.1 hypothetical protein [bacterium]